MQWRKTVKQSSQCAESGAVVARWEGRQGNGGGTERAWSVCVERGVATRGAVLCRATAGAGGEDGGERRI